MEYAPEDESTSIGWTGRSYAPQDAGGLRVGAGHSPRWVRIFAIPAGCSGIYQGVPVSAEELAHEGRGTGRTLASRQAPLG